MKKRLKVMSLQIEESTPKELQAVALVKLY